MSTYIISSLLSLNCSHMVNFPFLLVLKSLILFLRGCLYLKDWHFVNAFPDYEAYTTPSLFKEVYIITMVPKNGHYVKFNFNRPIPGLSTDCW